MKISTNNLREFRKNKESNSFEEEKNSICNKDLTAASNGFADKFGFKNAKIFPELRQNGLINNNNLINISVEIDENENNNQLDYSMKSLKELVYINEDTVKKTLPGLIISLLLRNNNSITEDFLINNISPIIGELRKPDGSKYKGNPIRVIKSALCSSGVFEKLEDKKDFEAGEISLRLNETSGSAHKQIIVLGDDSDDEIISSENEYKIDVKRNHSSISWTVKPKEAIQYLSRTIEKFQIKIIEKEKKLEEKQMTLLGKKRIRCSLKKHNIKVHKIFNVLDDLLKNYKRNPELKNILKSPFNNVNTATDLFKKCDNENICMGILLCFKFFKPFINKVLRNNTEDKKEKNDQLKNLNLKMEEMENKLIDLQKNLIDTCKLESNMNNN